MNRTMVSWVSLAVVCLAIAPASATAADVKVFMLDGRVLKGELLVVRDTALLIDHGGGYKMWRGSRKPENILLPFDSIQTVELMGSSYLWYGAAIGLVLGVGIGAAAAPPPSDDFGGMAQTGWMVLGGLGGLLAGSAVGASISSPGALVTAESPGGFGVLRDFAKYDGDEPAYLEGM